MSRGTRTLLLGLCGLAGIGTALGLFALTREPKDPADVKIIAHGEPIEPIGAVGVGTDGAPCFQERGSVEAGWQHA